MILKRPYAFLIKHFKMIHLIISAILFFIVYKCRTIYLFLGKCIKDVVNKYDAINYINYGIFWWIIILIILFFIVYWLLKYKNKPKNIYIFSIVSYAIVGIVLFLVINYMGSFSNQVLNQKTIRLYRDVLFMAMLLQYYIIIVMLIRGMGFDIKKFDFRKDFQEMNIESSDSEEVEVNLGIDTTNVRRGLRKQKREFGYYFKEFKSYIIITLIIIIIVVGFKGYSYFNNKYKIYNFNDYIGEDNILKVNKAFYSIIGDNNYVIVDFSIYKNGVKERFNSGNLILEIDGKKYTPNKTICSKFSNLGICYKQQYITNEERDYIMTYVVDNINFQKDYIIYSDSYDKNYKVKINLANYE